MEPGTIFTQPDPPAGSPGTSGSVRPPWGYVSTVIWTVLVFFLASLAGLTFYGWVFGFDQVAALPEKFRVNPSAQFDGLLLCYVSLPSAAVQIAVFALLIRLKGWSFSDYLALVIPGPRAIGFSLALIAALVVLSDGAMAVLGRNPVPEFQIVAYQTSKDAGVLLLLFVVIVLIAPITEEIMFRGFLFRGLVRRPSHAPYAIVLISLAFAVIHQQYDLIGLTQVFVMALILGFARYFSGSTILTMLMHMFANFIAMAETVVYLEWWKM
jgi:uncharacterized protein